MSDTPKINLTINQGATFRQKFIWQDVKKRPVNLTGYQARMQVREDITASGVMVELTTENGGIILGGGLGSVTLFLSDTATSALSFAKGVYDIELISPANEVYRLVGGTVSVSPEVTR